jgi:hypothetical protein
MEQQQKRIGRPLKAPQSGKRVSLGLKVTAEIKQRLDDAARANGRTQSQEAEFRLERSFDREGLLPEVLTLAYGKPVADVLIDKRTQLAKLDARHFKRMLNSDSVTRRWAKLERGEWAAVKSRAKLREIFGELEEKEPQWRKVDVDTARSAVREYLERIRSSIFEESEEETASAPPQRSHGRIRVKEHRAKR